MFNIIFNKYSKSILFVFVLIIFATFIILLPMWQAGFVADSSAEKTIAPISFNDLLASVQHTPTMIKDGISSGRAHLFPILTHPWSLFINSHGLLSVHLSTLLFTMVGLVLFYFFLRQVFLLNHKVSLIIVALCPFLFQIRSYHDPFLVYAGSFQAYFSLFLLSAIFLNKFFSTTKIRWAFLATMFFSFGVHSHEANIMFLPILILIYLFRFRKIFLSKIWPFIIMSFSCLHAYFFSKIWQFLLQMPQQAFNYDGTATSFTNIPITVKTWFVQSIAALPLNSFLGRLSQESLSYYPHLWLDNISIFFLFLFVFGLAFYLLFNQVKKINITGRQIIFLIFVGILLCCLPALPVALSVKYQSDLALFGLRGGMGYIMVYYQYFGVAILGGLILCFIFNKIPLKKTFLVITTCLCSLIFYLTYISNLANVKQVNKAYDEWSVPINRAFHNDFFDDLENKTVNLYLTHRDVNYYQENDQNIHYLLGLRSIFGDKTIINQTPNLESDSYFLYYDQVDEHTGYVILASVTGFYEGMPTGNKIKIYYYSSYLNDNWPNGIFPVLRRDLYTSYYIVSPDGQLQMKHDRQWIVRDRNDNSVTIEFISEDPILLDSIIPQIIQNDRTSLQLISPVN